MSDVFMASATICHILAITKLNSKNTTINFYITKMFFHFRRDCYNKIIFLLVEMRSWYLPKYDPWKLVI